MCVSGWKHHVVIWRRWLRETWTGKFHSEGHAGEGGGIAWSWCEEGCVWDAIHSGTDSWWQSLHLGTRYICLIYSLGWAVSRMSNMMMILMVNWLSWCLFTLAVWKQSQASVAVVELTLVIWLHYTTARILFMINIMTERVRDRLQKTLVHCVTKHSSKNETWLRDVKISVLGRTF